MTDIERAFLTAIAAEPDVDVHRLIYADWLDEQAGEATPRGEFIRVQCRLDEVPEEPEVCHPVLTNGRPAREHGRFCDYCKWTEEYEWSRALRRRESELLLEAHKWTMDLENIFGENCLRGGWCLYFVRGFISRITLPTDAFLRYAADIIEAVPMLEEVRLTDKEPGRGAGGESIWLFGNVVEERSDTLPLVLLSFFPDQPGRYYTRRYSLEIDAIRVASAACLAFARDQLARRRDPKKYARPRSVTYP